MQRAKKIKQYEVNKLKLLIPYFNTILQIVCDIICSKTDFEKKKMFVCICCSQSIQHTAPQDSPLCFVLLLASVCFQLLLRHSLSASGTA